MKRYGKILCTLTITAMMSSLFVGCGGEANSSQQASAGKGGKINIIVVTKALNSDNWQLVQNGAMSAGKALGVDVKVIGPNDESDIATQTSMMEDSIVKKVSCLVVAPSQPSAAIATFDKAVEANIPVVLIDTDAKWDKKKSFVGTGNFEGGKLGGKYLAEKVGKGAEVVIIRGLLGDATHDDRVNGAKESLEAAGVKVVEIQPANSDRNKAMTVMENLLQTHPNLKGVFATSDDMALGAARALQQTKRSDIVSVGFDGSPNGLKAIKAGELTASVAQNSYNIGKLGVETAVRVVKGEKVDKRIDTGTRMVTKENVDQIQEELNKEFGK